MPKLQSTLPINLNDYITPLFTFTRGDLEVPQLTVLADILRDNMQDESFILLSPKLCISVPLLTTYGYEMQATLLTDRLSDLFRSRISKISIFPFTERGIPFIAHIDTHFKYHKFNTSHIQDDIKGYIVNEETLKTYL